MTTNSERTIGQAMALLHATDRPDIPTVFQSLAKLKRYKEVVEFINKWHEQHFEKCAAGAKRVLEHLHVQIELDKTNASVIEMQKFIKCLEAVHSKKLVEVILGMLYAYPVEQSVLDRVDLAKTDAFLLAKTPIAVHRLSMETPVRAPPMSEDQLKATELIAKRRHRDGNHIVSGLIYVQISCRESRNDEIIQLTTRLDLLKNKALPQVIFRSTTSSMTRVLQFVHSGSKSALEYLHRIVDGIELQRELVQGIGIPVCNQSDKELKEEVLNVHRLFTIITTHPQLKAFVHLPSSLC